MNEHPYRPLFVEVTPERRPRRSGALDTSSLTFVLESLYAPTRCPAGMTPSDSR